MKSACVAAPGDAYERVEYTDTLIATDSDPGDHVHFTKILGPEGLTIDPDTGFVSLTPQEADIGSHWVSLGAVRRLGRSGPLWPRSGRTSAHLLARGRFSAPRMVRDSVSD
ncbi:MAG: hypothetical protein IT384_32075 [Deltaproteobacteria bacterium]|nr:hypothetical protein [Deltaproteobacteria bacterium]